MATLNSIRLDGDRRFDRYDDEKETSVDAEKETGVVEVHPMALH